MKEAESCQGSWRFLLDDEKVWRTYGIADEFGLIRYVGCTTKALVARLHEHMAAARGRAKTGRESTAWLRWLRLQLSQGRALSIVEISVDNVGWMAREKERTVIAGLEAAGAELLNTHDRGRQRCRRCGHLEYLRTHVCAEVTAARVIYEATP